MRSATPPKGLKGRALPGPHDYEQIPELAERGRLRVEHFFRDMDGRLAGRDYVAGSRYTIADISAMVLIDFAGRAKLNVPDDCVAFAPLVRVRFGASEREGVRTRTLFAVPLALRHTRQVIFSRATVESARVEDFLPDRACGNGKTI